MEGDQPGFGVLLRRYRMATGLTQEALAERAGLSLRGVSDLERGLRRVPYPNTVERLSEALRLGAIDRAALQAAGRPGHPGVQNESASLPPRSALPGPLTSFVGRERELGELRRLLGTPRLVTLTGTGGIGKTRLAVEAAHQHAASFEQGVHFVSLAGVGSVTLLASAIAAALGMAFYGPTAPDLQLVGYLHDKQLLLLLDNFEHLLDGTGLLTDILSGAPAVTLLVTSRERLNLREEWVLSIDGLVFPDHRAIEPIEQYPAVQLFVERARQAQVDFMLAQNVQPVIDICQHVEGMPLALELAATWLRVMPCYQIALQTDRSLDLLTTPLRNVPDRHRSLRAVFDRSWNLLSDVESSVLARLSVFRGGFDLDAAEQVSGASLPLLAGLADKSLVRPTRTGRYDLHELLRQYLSEKLADTGDTSVVARRHFDFYSTLADQAEAQLYGPDQETWFDHLEIENDNLAAALAWSLNEEHAEAGLRLAAALGFFWEHRGHFHDGYEWLEKLLQIDRGAPVSVRAKALRTAGTFALYVGDPDKAVAQCEAALALAREADDQWNVAWCLAHLGFFEQTSPDLSRAVSLLEEALGLFRALGDGWGISHALRRLGWILTMRGDYARAAELLDEALKLARQAQNKHATSWALLLLGNVVWSQTRAPERTIALYEESLSLVRETRDKHNLHDLLFMLGQVAHAQKNYGQAQSRYDEALALVQERGGIDDPSWDLSPLVLGFAQLAMATGKAEQAAKLFGAAHVGVANPHHVFGNRTELDRDIAAARAQLGGPAFAAVFAQGQAMTMKQALAHALQGRQATPSPG